MMVYLFHIFRAFFLLNFLCKHFYAQFYRLRYFFLAPIPTVKLRKFFYQNKKDVYHISLFMYNLPFHTELFRQKKHHILKNIFRL